MQPSPHGEVTIDHLPDHRVRITMSGEIDLNCFTNEHRRAIESTEKGATVQIDASRCTFVDSVGLSFLLSMRSAAGRPPAFVAMRPSLRTLLRTSGVESLFEFETTDPRLARLAAP